MKPLQKTLNAPILKVKNFCLQTPDKRILAENISFKISQGTMFCIEGENGSGKSTLLNAIIERPAKSPQEIELLIDYKRIFYVPQLQDSEMHIPMTLRDTISIAFDRHISDEEIVNYGLIEKKHLDLFWNKASGGEKKRALLTKAFLCDPLLMVLDEPFNHLDKASREVICEELFNFLKGSSRSLILVTHDPLRDDTLAKIPHQTLSLS